MRSNSNRRILKLEGRRFALEFSNVERVDTTRSFNRYHDDREQFPAWMWKGEIAITHLGSRRTERANFHTDAFWREHVPGLDFHQIILLILHRKHLHTGKVREGGMCHIVDYIATQAIIKKVFGDKGSIHLEPIRVEEKDLITEGTPVYEWYEKIEVANEMVLVG